MRYLGLDLGTRTLGLSLSDTTGTIASTLKTIRFDEGDYDSLLPQLKEIEIGTASCRERVLIQV